MAEKIYWRFKIPGPRWMGPILQVELYMGPRDGDPIERDERESDS